MTQKEFKDRTGMTVTPEEFDYILWLYMNTPFDKDKFCADFKEHGKSIIMRAVQTTARAALASVRIKEGQIKELVPVLLGKACAYQDSDFYTEAVRLVGMREVVSTKLRMNLPLWEKDVKYLTGVLDSEK